MGDGGAGGGDGADAANATAASESAVAAAVAQGEGVASPEGGFQGQGVAGEIASESQQSEGMIGEQGMAPGSEAPVGGEESPGGTGEKIKPLEAEEPEPTASEERKEEQKKARKKRRLLIGEEEEGMLPSANVKRRSLLGD